MSEVTLPTKLTKKQWKLLWQIAFGQSVLGTVFQVQGGGQVIRWKLDDQYDVSYLVRMLCKKGMVHVTSTDRLRSPVAGTTWLPGRLHHLKITKLGHENL